MGEGDVVAGWGRARCCIRGFKAHIVLRVVAMMMLLNCYTGVCSSPVRTSRARDSESAGLINTVPPSYPIRPGGPITVFFYRHGSLASTSSYMSSRIPHMEGNAQDLHLPTRPHAGFVRKILLL